MNKVLITIYNSKKIGGPNVSMRSVENSFLKKEYSFREIVIDERLGKIPRIQVLKRLIKEIKEYDPDIIYVSGLQLHGFYMTLAAFFAGYSKKTIMIVHGSSCDDLSFKGFGRFVFRYFIEPLSVRLSYITYTVCQEMANNPIVKRNARYFGGVIHNAAPVYDYTKMNRESIRVRLGLSNEDTVAIYTGRIVKDKGLDYLIDSINGLLPNNKLLIVGDGPYLNCLKERVESQSSISIIFLGHRTDIPELLYASDFFVFPSLHENLPNSIVEACAIGLPVIATCVGGIPEVIEDGVNGILVPPRDVEALKNAILLLSSDYLTRIKMGKKAKEVIERDFSQERLYAKINELFIKVMKNNE